MSFVAPFPRYHDYKDRIAKFKICDLEHGLPTVTLSIKQGKIKHRKNSLGPTKFVTVIEGNDALENLKEYLAIYGDLEQILIELNIEQNEFMLFHIEQVMEILQTYQK